MDTDYWTACWTAKASARLMAKQHDSYPAAARPKLVFVGSTLSFLNFAGYTSYCPPKAAVRSLADTLRNELKLFGIDVHSFFPAGILSPGFENENIAKPQLTKDIEGSDVPLPPLEVAKHLLKGESAFPLFLGPSRDDPVTVPSLTRRASPFDRHLSTRVLD